MKCVMKGDPCQTYSISRPGVRYYADPDGFLFEVDEQDVPDMERSGCTRFNAHAEQHKPGDVLQKDAQDISAQDISAEDVGDVLK